MLYNFRMFELMYVSRALIDLDEREMEAFLGVSRARNQAAAITGMLLHIHDKPFQQSYFVQVLEGSQAAVERTFHRIAADELHTGITVVHRGVHERRFFQAWQMGLATMNIEVARSLTRDYLPEDVAETTLELLSNEFLARSLLTLAAGQAAAADPHLDTPPGFG